MGMQDIRDAYGVPAKRGARVKFTGNPHKNPSFGTITGTRGQYLRVRMDGDDRTGTYHPKWEMEYLPATGSAEAKV